MRHRSFIINIQVRDLWESFPWSYNKWRVFQGPEHFLAQKYGKSVPTTTTTTGKYRAFSFSSCRCYEWSVIIAASRLQKPFKLRIPIITPFSADTLLLPGSQKYHTPFSHIWSHLWKKPKQQNCVSATDWRTRQFNLPNLSMLMMPCTVYVPCPVGWLLYLAICEWIPPDIFTTTFRAHS